MEVPLKIDALHNGKSHLEMDDDWGYPVMTQETSIWWFPQMEVAQGWFTAEDLMINMDDLGLILVNPPYLYKYRIILK